MSLNLVNLRSRTHALLADRDCLFYRLPLSRCRITPSLSPTLFLIYTLHSLFPLNNFRLYFRFLSLPLSCHHFIVLRYTSVIYSTLVFANAVTSSCITFSSSSSAQNVPASVTEADILITSPNIICRCHPYYHQ
jgi:hypothetical protein